MTEHLRNRDLKAFLSCVQEISAIPSLEVFPEHVLRALEPVVPCDIAGYTELNSRDFSVPKNHLAQGGELVPDLFPDSLAVFSRHMHEHPLVAYFERTGDPQAMKMSDFLTSRQYRQLGLYQEFYRHLHGKYHMVLSLPAPPPLLVGLAFNRDKSDFPERERTLLNLLGPSMAQTYLRLEALALARAEVVMLQQVMECEDIGVIAVTDSARPVWMNPTAKKSLQTFFGNREFTNQTLPDALHSWLQESLIFMKRGGRARSFRTFKTDRKLEVRLVHDPEMGEPWLLVLKEVQGNGQVNHLSDRFGLTPRENEILQLVSQGKTNDEIATRLGVSLRTIHKHLEHVYEKMGVENRTAAVARLYELPED